MATVLVGTDGSPNAAAALQWALEYARRNHANLRVMHVWHYPYAASEVGAMMAPPQEVFEEKARAALDEALTGLDTSGVVVEKCVRAGSPAAVLLEESKNADTLVVGARGHGGFAGLVLGSTATHCARHAQIPTVVIPRRAGAKD
ncbi:MAG TPA: universal stress protein [Acidimicrobiales bacterium]|nr:universal stress protein [Acidimicrobiales bacterium]